jgi:hypothetical protein
MTVSCNINMERGTIHLRIKIYKGLSKTPNTIYYMVISLHLVKNKKSMYWEMMIRWRIKENIRKSFFLSYKFCYKQQKTVKVENNFYSYYLKSLLLSNVYIYVYVYLHMYGITVYIYISIQIYLYFEYIEISEYFYSDILILYSHIIIYPSKVWEFKAL